MSRWRDFDSYFFVLVPVADPLFNGAYPIIFLAFFTKIRKKGEVSMRVKKRTLQTSHSSCVSLQTLCCNLSPFLSPLCSVRYPCQIVSHSQWRRVLNNLNTGAHIQKSPRKHSPIWVKKTCNLPCEKKYSWHVTTFISSASASYHISYLTRGVLTWLKLAPLRCCK